MKNLIIAITILLISTLSCGKNKEKQYLDTPYLYGGLALLVTFAAGTTYYLTKDDATKQGSQIPTTSISRRLSDDGNMYRYLKGIRTNAMLGDHEIRPLSQIVNMPIVVLRKENNNLIERIYFPDGKGANDFQNIEQYIFVQNTNNFHFKTFIPAPGVTLAQIAPAMPIAGVAKEGDYQTGHAGMNDCLIASVRGNPNAPKINKTNKEIRNQIADINQHQLNVDFFTPEVRGVNDQHSLLLTSSIDDIPVGYQGVVRIQNNGDYFQQGQLNKVSPDKIHRRADWYLANKEGTWELKYGSEGNLIAAKQTGARQVNGETEVLDPPIEYDLENIPHHITFSSSQQCIKYR